MQRCRYFHPCFLRLRVVTQTSPDGLGCVPGPIFLFLCIFSTDRSMISLVHCLLSCSRASREISRYHDMRRNFFLLSFIVQVVQPWLSTDDPDGYTEWQGWARTTDQMVMLNLCAESRRHSMSSASVVAQQKLDLISYELFRVYSGY